MIFDAIIAILLLAGAGFILVGSIGLLKLRGSMSRLHAPTKAATLGVGALLLASIVEAFVYSNGSLHEMLVVAFLFVTAPISGNFIAKVHLHRQRGKADFPQAPSDTNWATYSEK